LAALIACGGFAAAGQVDSRYRSIAVRRTPPQPVRRAEGTGTQQQRRRSTALSSNVGSATLSAGVGS